MRRGILFIAVFVCTVALAGCSNKKEANGNESVNASVSESESVSEGESVEQSYQVILEDAGERTVELVKAIRDVTDDSLSTVKDYFDNAPVCVWETTDKELAEEMKNSMEQCGAQVTIKEVE